MSKLTLLNLPAIVKEFSGLRTITRHYAVKGEAVTVAAVEAECFLPFATPDEEFGDALLTEQRVVRVDGKPSSHVVELVRVFREFVPDMLVNVGDDVISRDESGRETVQKTSVCLAIDAEALIPAIGTVIDGKAVSNVAIQKNGVGARVVITTISAGRLSESTQESNNGRLTKKTLVYFNEIPPTPAGFTLVDTAIQNPDGVPTYSYGFARGEGEISRSIDYSQSSNQGVTGVTRTTIRHLTGPEVDLDPTALAGSVKIGQDMAEQDGYRVWSITYAKGTGLVLDDVDTRHNGKLFIYHRVALGAAPDTPAARIGGAVMLVGESVREEAGYAVYDSRWAEGVGEVGRDTDTRHNGALVLVNITHLTAASVADQPTIAPGSGYLLVSSGFREQDGYRLWTARWGKGDGIISTTVSRSHKGRLITTRIVKLSPTSTAVPPVAPVGSIGGVVTLVDSERREEEGHVLFSYRWAEGFGRISEGIRTRNDGLRTQTYVSLGLKETPPGIVIVDEQDELDGVTRYTVTTMQNAAGLSPVVGEFSFQKHVPFLYPGRAKAYEITVEGSPRKLVDVFLSSPVETEVNATVTISYVTTNTLVVVGRWNPTSWATVEARFITNHGRPTAVIKGLRGFRSVSSAPIEVEMPVFPDPDDPGGTIMGYIVYGGTTGTLRVVGGPPNPDNKTYVLDATLEPAFTGVDGTIYYRKTIISATIPTQPDLPV